MRISEKLRRKVLDGSVEDTPEGIVVEGTRFIGRYSAFIDGKLVEVSRNKIPLEGLIYFLSAGLLGAPQLNKFYLAIFSGAVNPQDNWTAANFSSNANEIVSSTEGYSNPTRPQWIPDTTTPTTNAVGNLDSLATFNIVCSSTLNIAGAALLSDETKGGTSGKLISAMRYDNVHTVNNGTTYQLGYEIELQDI